MKEHHLRKYKIDDLGKSIEIVSEEETFNVPKDKVKDVFMIKSWKWGHVKWYHKLFVGIAYAAISIFIFRFTFTWAEQTDVLEEVPELFVYIGFTLFILSGILFLGMISLLFEATSNFPGLTVVLSKRLFGKRYRAIVIQRATIEYHLIVGNKRNQVELLDEVMALLKD